MSRRVLPGRVQLFLHRRDVKDDACRCPAAQSPIDSSAAAPAHFFFHDDNEFCSVACNFFFVDGMLSTGAKP